MVHGAGATMKGCAAMRQRSFYAEDNERKVQHALGP